MNKTVYAYIDGIRLWDVLQLALAENVMLNDMKERRLLLVLGKRRISKWRK